ncbi:MAG: hypothetical protein Q8P91_00555 [bacterium]|nr:hypothetical protein [bacterium]
MIVKTKTNEKDSSKIKLDLYFLRKFIEFSKEHNFRLIVSGGYGLDGILNTITRPHNDIDIILYGQFSRKKIIQLIKEFVSNLYSDTQFSGEPNPFTECIDINAKGFGCNLYYVETINDPYIDLYTIKLIDGKTQTNSEEQFPSSVKAKLQGIEYEAQNPNLHLADILFKRKQNNKQTKHKQDIINLREITDKSKVKSLLKFYK